MIISASVQIEGRECKEYEKEIDDFAFPQATEFYVESVEGASFTVLAHLTEISPMSPLRRKHIRCNLYIDGVKMDAKDSKKTNQSNYAFRFTGKRTSLMEKRSFVFAGAPSIESSIGGESNDESEKCSSSLRGSICLEFFAGSRKKIDKIQKNAVMGYKKYSSPLKTPKKELAMMSMPSHGTLLGQSSVSPVNKSTFGFAKFSYDDRDEPFGVIKINYRSKQDLEAVGIAVDGDVSSSTSAQSCFQSRKRAASPLHAKGSFSNNPCYKKARDEL